MTKLLRYITGYIIGAFLFVLLIPFLIVKLSSALDPLLKIKVINNLSMQIIISLPFLIIGLLFMIWSNLCIIHHRKRRPDGRLRHGNNSPYKNTCYCWAL